jgi:hypothetical protein
MKTQRIVMLALSLIIIVLATVSGCKKDSAGVKSVTLNVKSSAVKSGTATLLEIPLQIGSLSVISANVNIADIKIEENSGEENQQGENNTGGNDNEGSNSEADNGDISLPGPFALDISNGTSSLGQVSVYPGTFKKVNFQFIANAANPFNGKTIVISGNYIKPDGYTIPFTINSNFSEQVQLLIANGGIVATANSTQDIMILFDLNAWLNLDFAGAQVVNNQIVIDNNNNVALLNSFNANVAANIDAENENK